MVFVKNARNAKRLVSEIYIFTSHLTPYALSLMFLSLMNFLDGVHSF